MTTRPAQKRMSSEGFTLVEVLVAVMVLAIGLVMVVEVMGRTQHALRISQNLVIASQLAEEQLTVAEIEVREYQKLHFSASRDKVEAQGKTFEVSRSSSPYIDASMQDETKVNKLAIEIDWKEGATRQSKLKVTSLLLNREKDDQSVATTN